MLRIQLFSNATLIFMITTILNQYAAFADSKSAPSKFFQIKCTTNERATGCTAPYPRCAKGTDQQSIVTTCMRSAGEKLCPDFSWEKCCAANCFIRKGGVDSDGVVRLTGMNECMNECLAAPAAQVFWPKADIKGKK